MDDDEYWNIVGKLGSSRGESGASIVPEAKQNYENLKKDNLAEYAKYQRNVDIIMGMSDKEIEEYIIENDKNNQDSRWSGWKGYYKAKNIYDSSMASANTWKTIQTTYWEFGKTRWTSNEYWCGPYALAMIMSGKYHKARFWEIEDNFASYFDKANKANKSDNAGSMTFGEFRKALRDNGWGDIQGGYGAVWYDKTAEKMYQHIKGGNPLLVHIWGHWIFSFETAFKSKKNCFGTRYHRDFRMTDNGTSKYNNLRKNDGTWWMDENNWRIIWVHPITIN